MGKPRDERRSKRIDTRNGQRELTTTRRIVMSWDQEPSNVHQAKRSAFKLMFLDLQVLVHGSVYAISPEELISTRPCFIPPKKLETHSGLDK